MDGAVPPVIMESLRQVWVDFLGHLPFFGAGLLAILATWVASVLLRMLLGRLLRRWACGHY